MHGPGLRGGLLPMAEKWGISDDFEREAAVERAAPHELEELVHSIDHTTDEDLYGWLLGSESFNPDPTDEYLAITCLTMAIHSAKPSREARMSGQALIGGASTRVVQRHHRQDRGEASGAARGSV
jgi:hypothetical protein